MNISFNTRMFRFLQVMKTISLVLNLNTWNSDCINSLSLDSKVEQI